MEGNRYIDCMSAYSALSHGHCHPELIATLTEQAHKLTLTSRAFHSPALGPFVQYACELTKMSGGCPMNTGAEAVEVAIKAARKWAYKIKGVPDNQAEIIVCKNNFHGRTTTVISFSSESLYRDDFGPLTPGFKLITYGDAKALADAITPNTAAFIVEPIQGEAGIVMPPGGYLQECAKICKKNNVLFIADEIQTGLGRTGKFLACEHENVQPDGVILGKALGGGLLPVSLFLARKDVIDVFTPGTHGSTFGGNELAATVAHKALQIIVNDKYSENSAVLGDFFLQRLLQIKSPLITTIRGKGLFIGIEINPKLYSAREVCLALMANGVLSKETHETVVRLAPPLIINRQQIEDVAEIIVTTFNELTKQHK
ncbi:MAG: ornithine--oxo-acid transaminase, partial [Pseudomonadota bacterium]|nr:ornithine--oxo-acid transaminase [Pseudomonadota bacterium]